MKAGQLCFGIICSSLLTLGAMALAQAPTPQPPPQAPKLTALERALDRRLGVEFGANVACNRDLIALDDAATQIQTERDAAIKDLAIAKGRIAELEAAAAPKEPTK